MKVLLPQLCLYRCDPLFLPVKLVSEPCSCLGTNLLNGEANTSRWFSLNGSIYHVWKGKMEDLFYVKDYYLPVFTTEKPENKTDAEWTILHRQGIINHLAGMGIKFEDELQGLWLLGTLPDTWETFRTSLSNSAPDGVITMELAKGSILNEETRRKSQGSSSQSDVLVIERRGRSQSRGPSNRGWKTGLIKIADILRYFAEVDTDRLDNDDMVPRYGIRDLSSMEEKGMENILVSVSSLVERHERKKLKCIRTDNGGEYIGPFDAYCREHGIQHQKTPPKTPQLNGLAERMNRTLVERASVHIPKDERSKLDVKGKPCVFLGYGQDEFGYRLYDPVQKKLVRSRDVVFEEDLTLKDVEKAERETIPQHNDDLIDLDPVPPKHFDSQFGDDIQNDEEQGADDVDAQEQPNLDEDVHPELPVPDMPPFLPLRRSTRDHHPSTRYSAHEYVLLTDGGEPECYAEAMEDEHKKEWFEAMEDEMNSLHENNTFELVKLPKGKRALKNKWVYKLKTEEHTSRPRYKARLVVKGFSQKRGIDFDEIFSPVVKMGSIRVVLGLAASLDLEVEQMDVKTAFLHGDLDKEIYMEQPEGFQVKGKEGYVCRLQKSLYGLKQAPRQWYKKFESVIGKQGYRKTSSDHCVFFQKFGDDDFIILLLYVDDMLIVGKNIGRIAQLKRDLSKSFSVKDLGPAKQIIGIRIFCDRGAKKLHISQEQYIEKVLCRFNMDKAKVVSSPLTTNFKLTDKDFPSFKKNIEKMDKVLYASVVGSLMYTIVCTRPDLAHAVGVVSRFLSNHSKKHWEAVKCIFRYMRGTSKLGITFGNGKPMLVGFTDSYMAGNKDNMKSTSGYLMTFAGGAVSWHSRLQKCVALSTTKAEYMAATKADALEDGMFELNNVYTDDNASDMLTKAVARESGRCVARSPGWRTHPYRQKRDRFVGYFSLAHED
ncbi:putative RNA-directed DNA polymerase [Tanacetum coccineum]